MDGSNEATIASDCTQIHRLMDNYKEQRLRTFHIITCVSTSYMPLMDASLVYNIPIHVF